MEDRHTQLEIDFASAGNDLNFRRYVEKTGGMFTSARKSGIWISQSKPKIINISQDQNTLVIDLQHHIKQAFQGRHNRDAHNVPDQSEDGQVHLRLFLIREKSLPAFPEIRTVGEGRDLNLGFFSPNHQLIGTPAELTTPIQRFNLDYEETITFYLKDFPSEYVEVAKTAILSWNKAFDHDYLDVKVAPKHVDVGDPRYHVIKWFDGTDQSLGWAGVAKMIVAPDSGQVLSGSIYIQGNTISNLYKDIMDYSQQVSQNTHNDLEGKIGNLSFESDQGESPVIPFLVDTEKNFEDYMKGYYLETIAHEVGHVLGLRHNFAASSNLNSVGQATSVMDYLPRSKRSDFQGPGEYDIQAIQWGYYNRAPSIKARDFCTDEHVRKVWYCMKGDFGNPVDFTIQGLIDSVELITTSNVPVEKPSQISSIGGLIEKAHKLWKLRLDMPPRSAPKCLRSFRMLTKVYSWLNQVARSK